jgi:hypothetical protein
VVSAQETLPLWGNISGRILGRRNLCIVFQKIGVQTLVWSNAKINIGLWPKYLSEKL